MSSILVILLPEMGEKERERERQVDAARTRALSIRESRSLRASLSRLHAREPEFARRPIDKGVKRKRERERVSVSHLRDRPPFTRAKRALSRCREQPFHFGIFSEIRIYSVAGCERGESRREESALRNSGRNEFFRSLMMLLGCPSAQWHSGA